MQSFVRGSTLICFYTRYGRSRLKPCFRQILVLNDRARPKNKIKLKKDVKSLYGQTNSSDSFCE